MDRFPGKEVRSLHSIAKLNEEHANLQCQLNGSRTNVKVLSETIIKLSQEVEHALLRKKWSSQLKVDVGTNKERVQSPVEDAMAICTELRTSPEYIEDVSAALNQRQSSLQETISALTKEIADLTDT